MSLQPGVPRGGCRISAVVTAYRFERFIRAAIASIQRQSRPVDEIVVVDNQSDDATPVILAELAAQDARIVLVDVPPRGPAAARNRGLAAASGDIIAMLDGDDAWPADKIARQMARLESEPAIDMVTGPTSFTDAIDDHTLAPPPGARVETLLQPNIGACLYCRAVFERLGGFDESYRYADDLDLLLRLRDAGIVFDTLPEVALYHRRYPGSLLTTVDPRRSQEFVRAVAASRRRRREHGLPPAEPLLAGGVA